MSNRLVFLGIPLPLFLHKLTGPTIQDGMVWGGGEMRWVSRGCEEWREIHELSTVVDLLGRFASTIVLEIIYFIKQA